MIAGFTSAILAARKEADSDDASEVGFASISEIYSAMNVANGCEASFFFAGGQIDYTCASTSLENSTNHRKGCG
jgi:hypothetical protein